MRTTLGNKEVPQTFFHNFPYSLKYDLVRTIYNLAFRNFVASKKVDFAKFADFRLLSTLLF